MEGRNASEVVCLWFSYGFSQMETNIVRHFRFLDFRLIAMIAGCHNLSKVVDLAPWKAGMRQKLYAYGFPMVFNGWKPTLSEIVDFLTLERF